jgi:putative aldouronate transport system permease protein
MVDSIIKNRNDRKIENAKQKAITKNKYQLKSTGEKVFNKCMNLLGILISLVCMYPLLYVLVASVSKPLFVDSGAVIFAPIGFNLESYAKAISKPGIWVSYANTIFYTLFGVLCNMAFSTTMAYALSRKKLVFKKFFTLFTIFTMWFSAGIIPLYLAFRDFHMLDTRTAIIYGFAINTYNMIILKSFFEQVPSSLEEAAFIDGANNIQIFWKIYLPLSKPALATVGLFYGVSRWNGYFWAMNLLTSDKKLPLQVLLKKLIVDRMANETEAQIITAVNNSSPLTVIYALIIIAIIPMIIAYPLIQKYFKSGLTIGANKG